MHLSTKVKDICNLTDFIPVNLRMQSWHVHECMHRNVIHLLLPAQILQPITSSIELLKATRQWAALCQPPVERKLLCWSIAIILAWFPCHDNPPNMFGKFGNFSQNGSKDLSKLILWTFGGDSWFARFRPN